MERMVLSMRYFLSILCLLFIVACDKQQTKIIDEEHKTFYVNGVSALDGYEAVSNSLKNIGFTIDKDGVAECDLTNVGKGFTYYVNYFDNLFDDASVRLFFSKPQLNKFATLGKKSEFEPGKVRSHAEETRH